MGVHSMCTVVWMKLLFCVGIVHTNLYNSISWVSDTMQYLELHYNASHACVVGFKSQLFFKGGSL